MQLNGLVVAKNCCSLKNYSLFRSTLVTSILFRHTLPVSISSFSFHLHCCCAVGGGAFAEQTAWPEFHNGVAAGLRLAPGTHQLTRTWVVYNKPLGGYPENSGCGCCVA